MLAPLSVIYFRQTAPQRVRAWAMQVDRLLGGKGPVPAGVAVSAAMKDQLAEPVRGEGLEVRELSVRYGGTAAVFQLDLHAPTGMITGLIGPNGAGKTTTFNACCGLVKPTSGQIVLHGQDVSRLGPSARARRGLGRTFQRVELFNSLTVRQNIAMGREAIMAGGNPIRQFLARRGDSKLVAAAVEQAASITGIADLLDMKVSDTSTGQRRLVELARVLAGPFDMILLDEPSSGLDLRETEEFGRILTEVVAERAIGILIVEHDMSLVRQICDRVYVLDFGQKIFEGTPSEMVASPVVRGGVPRVRSGRRRARAGRGRSDCRVSRRGSRPLSAETGAMAQTSTPR